MTRGRGVPSVTPARARTTDDDQDAMLGTYPYTCSRCGVVCESVAELADPDHHDWK